MKSWRSIRHVRINFAGPVDPAPFDALEDVRSVEVDGPDVEIRTKVAEGLCKLMMIDAISSSKLFQRLIYMWFNPLADSDGKLRHILGTFFPLYASVSRAHQVGK